MRTPIVMILGFVLVSSMAGQTHGIIEGSVVDRTTAEGIAGANVRVQGTQWGAVTNAEGLFVIRFVVPGTYELHTRYLGYREVITRDVLVNPGTRTVLRIDMDESALDVEPVIVVAQRPLIQKDQATTTFNISAQKIASLPVSTVNEVLSLQPGTTLEGNVRGGKAFATVYAVDGLTTSDLIAGGPSLSLPRSAIAGVTIHTGGVEAEFGNSQSGLVNVLTRSGSEVQQFHARYERDSWVPMKTFRQHSNLSELEVSASGPIIAGDLAYIISTAYHTEDSQWWQDFDGQVQSPVIQELNAFAKIDLNAADVHKTTLQVMYTGRQWRDYEFTWRYNLAGLPERSKAGLRAVLSHNWTPIPRLLLTLTGSFFGQLSRIGTGSRGELSFDPYEYDFFLRYVVNGSRDWWADTRQGIGSLRFDGSVDAGGGHLMKLGAEISMFDLTSTVIKTEPQVSYYGKPLPLEPPVNTSYAYGYKPRSGSVYLQDKVQIATEGSILSVGLRFDFLDPTARRPLLEFVRIGSNQYEERIVEYVAATTKRQLSPRVSYTAPFSENGYVFVNYGHYVQFPLFDYLYGGLHPVQIRQGTKNVQAGNPDLEPERTVAWEIGVKHGVADQTFASLTYFRKRMDHQIDAKTLIPFDSKSAGDYGFASYVNNAEAQAEGIEVMVSKEAGKGVRGTLSYTYMMTEGVGETSDENILLAQWGFPPPARAYPLSWDQRHAIKAEGEILLFEFIRAHAVGFYNTARPYTFYPTRDGFTALDSTRVFLPNNARMEDFLLINMKLSADVEVGGGRSMMVFADIRNLLDRRNVRWMDSNGRIGGELGDPSAYHEPRRVRIGLEMHW